MDVFEKAAKTAKSIGNSIYSSTKEQGRLASLNVQKSVLEKKLNESYAEIGKRYVNYIGACEGGEPFDVSDILDAMQPTLDKLEEVKASISGKETEIKQQAEEKLKKKAQEEYNSEKEKLDKALEADIISKEEYDSKLSVAEKKLDNYELLRKINLQFEMGIITDEEKREKIKEVLR